MTTQSVTQLSIGRFHHFHLARQLVKHQLLECIWTGYPRVKLRDEPGIPPNRIQTFPWLYAPFMALSRYGLNQLSWLRKEWLWQAQETFDKHVAKHLQHSTTLVGLSGSSLQAGRRAQQLGGHYICDRGSSHIRFQDQIMHAEYARWGLKFPGIDPRTVAKEEAEYEQADIITVPSEFVKQSFLQMGVPANKLVKVVYGANLKRFYKIGSPPVDCFRVLWVGSVDLRKGFLDLLTAFQGLRHHRKELIVVGSIESDMQVLLAKQSLNGISFLGTLPNNRLPLLYSEAHVFVLPSLEEGLAMVQGEALACGCPVIASTNTGSEDLFTNNKEGFIIPIRAPSILQIKLQQLADDVELQQSMSEAAIQRIHTLGGWDEYGTNFASLLNSL